jgi:hypothetical protein
MDAIEVYTAHEARLICRHPHQMIHMQPPERREVMLEVREMIDTEVNAVDVRELIDTEIDTVSGGSFHSTGGPAVAFDTATYTNQILDGPAHWPGNEEWGTERVPHPFEEGTLQIVGHRVVSAWWAGRPRGAPGRTPPRI